MKKRKNHLPEFKAKVALEAIREEMTLACKTQCNIGPQKRSHNVIVAE